MKIMVYAPIISWQIDVETMETVKTLFWGTTKSLQMVTTAMKLKDPHSLEEKHIQKQRHYFTDKGLYSQSYGSSSLHVWM